VPPSTRSPMHQRAKSPSVSANRPVPRRHGPSVVTLVGAIRAAVTPVELRHAADGYPDATVRAAVEAGLRECPLAAAEGDLDAPALVTFWLLDADSFEWFPPPTLENTIAAIQQHLVASAD
jgi:hypothetical protein